jgi:hypothetical protein
LGAKRIDSIITKPLPFIQARPNIFARHIVLPELVYEMVAEVRGRNGVGGEELEPLNEADAVASLEAAYKAGIRGVAVCFMHAYRWVHAHTTERPWLHPCRPHSSKPQPELSSSP